MNNLSFAKGIHVAVSSEIINLIFLCFTKLMTLLIHDSVTLSETLIFRIITILADVYGEKIEGIQQNGATATQGVYRSYISPIKYILLLYFENFFSTAYQGMENV